MSPPANSGSPWETWRKAWSAWARGVGLDIAWANQSDNPPERRKPYARLQVLSVRALGTDEQTEVFNEIMSEQNRVLQGLREITLSVQVIANAKPLLGESAWAWADEMASVLETDETAEALRQAGLSVSSVGQAVDLGGLEQSQYVSRVTFEVVFLGAFYRRNPAAGGWVDRIIGEGDLEGNSSPELTFDVEGP